MGEDGGVVGEIFEMGGVGDWVAFGLGGGRIGTDDEAELGFVVEGCSLWAEDGGGLMRWGKDGRRRFEEEEGLGGTGGGQFGNVIADSINAC